MSDAVMDQPRTNGQVANNPPVDAPAPQASQFDIVQILWRWKWLPILGSLIGAGLGFLVFLAAACHLQSVGLGASGQHMPIPTRNSFFEPVDKGITRADESMVIRSQAVLLLAVKKGKLNEQDNTEFDGLAT